MKHIPKSLEEWLKDNEAIPISEFGKKLKENYHCYIHKDYFPEINEKALPRYWWN